MPGVLGGREAGCGALDGTGCFGNDRAWRWRGVVSGIGSGMNGRGREVGRFLSDPGVSVIVVEHRDRLTRFGFEHLAAGLAGSGRRIVVLDESDTTDDLVRDVTVVLTSLCVGLFGRGSVSRRAADAVAVAIKEGGS